MAQTLKQPFTQGMQLAKGLGFNATRLATELHICRSQFERYTRTHFHCTPQMWLNAGRMSMARQMLRQNRMAKEVAYSLGFKQVSHFSREFKQFVGLSPKAFVAWNRSQIKNGTINKHQ